MKSQLLNNLLDSNTETEVLEFKKANANFDSEKLGKYFSALANEACLQDQDTAYIIFGVTDDKIIVGSKINDKKLNDFKQYVSDHTSPKTSFKKIHKIQTENGRVLIFEIPAANGGRAISWKGHRYGRNGESLAGLDDGKLERILLKGNIEDWSSQVVPDATLEDLSKGAIDFAKDQYLKKNPRIAKEIKEWSDEQFLNKAKLTIKDKITRTAIVLLGKPESDHFFSPSQAKITWILKDKDNNERDYEHFTCPLILSVDQVASKIRNLKYRYIKDGSLFPEEVDQYDQYIIRESLHNCIAHQDYSLNSKIIVIENEDSTLTFINSGSFIPETIEKVVLDDYPEIKYSNPFLVQAMVNLNMIDTIGSGIRKMFNIQKDKFFPLPDYQFIDNKVILNITGKVIDLKYARKLAMIPDLSLNDIILLDRVSKGHLLPKENYTYLKSKSLIEGRKPNYFISAKIAYNTGEESSYINMKGLDSKHYEALIIEYLRNFGSAQRAEIESLLFSKFSTLMSEDQKKTRVKNLLQKLRKDEIIKVESKTWFINSS